MMKFLLSCLFVFSLMNASAQSLQFQWAGRLGGTGIEEGYDVSTDALGFVYTVGKFEGTADMDPGPGIVNLVSAGSRDIFVSRFDSTGQLKWARRIGGSGDDLGEAIVVDATGSVYVAGGFKGVTDFDPGPSVFNMTAYGNGDVFICKLDTAGNFQWARQMGGPNLDFPFEIGVNGAGEVYLAGVYSATAQFGIPGSSDTLQSAGLLDGFICKLSPAGTLIWTKSIGGGFNDEVMDMFVEANGDVLMTGTFSFSADFDPGPGVFQLSTPNSKETYVCKLNNAGTFQWAVQFTGSNGAQGDGILKTAAGEVYVTGSFNGTIDFDPGAGVSNMSSTGNVDVFLVKLSDTGALLQALQIGGQLDQYAFDMVSDASGNIYLSSTSQGVADYDPGPGVFNLTSAGSADAIICKLDPAGNLVWAGAFSGINYEQGSAMSLHDNRNLYVTGLFIGQVDFDPGPAVFNLTPQGRDAFITRLSVSTVTGLGNISAGTFTVFPNPTNDGVWIRFDAFQPVELAIRSVDGSLVSRLPLMGVSPVRIELPATPGVYVLEAYDRQQQLMRSEVIKIR